MATDIVLGGYGYLLVPSCIFTVKVFTAHDLLRWLAFLSLVRFLTFFFGTSRSQNLYTLDSVFRVARFFSFWYNVQAHMRPYGKTLELSLDQVNEKNSREKFRRNARILHV